MQPEVVKNIMLAEDDPHLGPLLKDYLQSEGFVVHLFSEGASAISAVDKQMFDLYLLDIMMPVTDGLTIAKTIRQKHSHVPILFITAKSMRHDKRYAYEIGADDYIVKPFDEEELLWKIKAALRRAAGKEPLKEIRKFYIGLYLFDPANLSLTLNGEVKRITEKEGAILQCLAANRNQLVKRESLLLSVWGKNDYFLGRSLDVFITKIRKYLKEDPSHQH